MDSSIKERIFILWSQRYELYSSFDAHLVDSGWQVKHSTDIDVIKPYCDHSDAREQVCLGILGLVNHDFSDELRRQLLRFHEAGNSLFIASSRDQSGKSKSNINALTSKFGIKFNRDCVIRPNPYEQYHPEEARLSDFIANKGLLDAFKKYIKHQPSNQLMVGNIESRDGKNYQQTDGPHILYTKGCTLTVDRQSTIMMTSSDWALPVKQAICAFKRQETRGRVVTIGSSSMFSDQYLDKEDNRPLLSVLLEFIADEKFPINISDAKTIEIAKPVPTPAINRLINIPVPCLQETERLPAKNEIPNLIDKRLFNIDNSLLPTVIKAYRELNVNHEPLTLIKPTFEVAPIKPKLATHNFIIRRG